MALGASGARGGGRGGRARGDVPGVLDDGEPRDRRLVIILGASLAAHAAIAVWALAGDPPVDRPLLAPSSGRVFVPDEVAEMVIDASAFDATSALAPPAAAPAPRAPAPAAAVPAAPAAPRAPGHAAARPGHRPAQLDEDPHQIVDGLFADDAGLAPGGGVARRRPGDDLAAQIDAAKRRGGTASIGGGDTLLRGEDRPRTGTGPDCHCDDPSAPTSQAPRREAAPPAVHVARAPGGAASTTLTPDDVLRIINEQYLRGLARCQEEAMARGADGRGTITLELTIDGAGAAAAAAADGVDPRLDRCVEARAGGWRFPAPRDPHGAPAEARYRLSLALQAE